MCILAMGLNEYKCVVLYCGRSSWRSVSYRIRSGVTSREVSASHRFYKAQIEQLLQTWLTNTGTFRFEEEFNRTARILVTCV